MATKTLLFIGSLISVNASSQTVISDVTIVDVENTRLINHQSVLIEGTTIKQITPSEKFKIPANAIVIAGKDKYLMPGLIDAHAHTWDGDLYSDDGIDLTKYKAFQKAIDESKTRLATNYKRFLQCGITTIILPGTTISTFRSSDSLSKHDPMPSIYMAGKLISVSDFGNPHGLSPEDLIYDYAADVSTAKEIVQKQLTLHPAFIKILFVPDLTWRHISDSARAKYPVVKAIIEEAHKNGLKVAVHATEIITAQLAVEAGCDYLVHGIHDEIVGDDFIKLLKQKQTILCPTSNVEYPILRTYTQDAGYSNYELSHANPFVLKTLFDLQDLDSAIFQRTKHLWESDKGIFRRDSIRLINLKKLADAGIRIVTGTDAGSLGNMPAASYLPELLKMKQSGMTNWQIIQAATLNPTYFINQQEYLGSIKKGKIADLILLNKNPLADLENLEQIAMLFKNGKAISQDTLINETPDMIVQRMWNAYNSKNSQVFLASFTDDVKLYNFPESDLHQGMGSVEKKYGVEIQSTSNTHCEIKSRIISGETVVDKILIKEFGKITEEQILVFKTKDHKITGIYFIK